MKSIQDIKNYDMKKLVLFTILLISWAFLWPLSLVVLLSDNRTRILQDANRNISYRSASFKNYNAVLYLFVVDKFFRTMVYSRIGIVSYIFSWLWHTQSTFFPICKNIEGGIYLAHPFSTILNAKSIGANFTCRQCTTIGNKSEDALSEKPIIGNNVTVGANVVIIGNVKIGDNSIIGAGSVVVKDVPSNAIVAGNPAKVLRYV